MAIYQSDVELTEAQINDIAAFLKTLTGEYNGVPVTTTNDPDDVHGHDHE